MDNLFLLLFLASSIAFIVGLISPKKVIRWSSTEPTRKNVLKYLGSAIIISFIGFGIFVEPAQTTSDTTESQNNEITKNLEQPSKQEKQTENTNTLVDNQEILVSNSNIETIEKEDTSKSYDVVRIIDGDTVVLKIDGKDETIRLVGINTPETKDPRKPVECFGYEATNKAKELLENQRVTFTADPTQDIRDKYDRLLGYIHTENGVFFNFEMIKQGYAYEYTYNTSYQYQNEFKQAQNEAQKEKRGLWSPDTCNGELIIEEKQNTTSQTSTNKTEEISTNTSTLENSTNSTSEPIATPTAPTPSPEPDQTECNIKGNIASDGEKIYHYPGCASYSRTKIDESKGERWFCTSEEARAAGWREALNCY